MKFFPANINLNIAPENNITLKLSKGTLLSQGENGVSKCSFINILQLVLNGNIKLNSCSTIESKSLNKDDIETSDSSLLLFVLLSSTQLNFNNKLSLNQKFIDSKKGNNEISVLLQNQRKNNQYMYNLLKKINNLINNSPELKDSLRDLINVLKKDSKINNNYNKLMLKQLLYDNNILKKEDLKKINNQYNKNNKLENIENKDIALSLLSDNSDNNDVHNYMDKINNIFNLVKQKVAPHLDSKEIKEIKNFIDKILKNSSFVQNDVLSKDIDKNVVNNKKEDIYENSKIKDLLDVLEKSNGIVEKDNNIKQKLDSNLELSKEIDLNKKLTEGIVHKVEGSKSQHGELTDFTALNLKSVNLKKQKDNNHIKEFKDNILAHIMNNKNQDVNLEDSKIDFRDKILKQIENGVFKNLGQGKREISIKLHPPELGGLKITLQVQGKEVSLLIRAENHDVANTLNHHIANFEKSLENHGLKVVKIEVRNDLGSGHENAWAGFNNFRGGTKEQEPHSYKRTFFRLGMVGERDIEGLEPRAIDNKLLHKKGLYVVA